MDFRQIYIKIEENLNILDNKKMLNNTEQKCKIFEIKKIDAF